MRRLELVVSLVCFLCGLSVVAVAGASAFQSVSVAEVRLYAFDLKSGRIELEKFPESNARDGGTLETRPYPFPLDRQFIVGLRFAIVPGQSSGYGLPRSEAVKVMVTGHVRHVWRNFYLHGRTYDRNGNLSETASAWKFVPLDLVCDPTNVDVMYRNVRIKRIRVNGQCPE